MLYYLFEYLNSNFDLPGSGIFRYITFRSMMAICTSVMIAVFFGSRFINYLRKKQISDEVRNLGLDGEQKKHGTPTMGGVIIILAIVVPVLLFARLTNVYIILLVLATIWTAALGFVDDYVKIRGNKKGVDGKYKILGQVILGLMVGMTLHFNENVVLRDFTHTLNELGYLDYKSTKTTIPFLKNNELDYAKLFFFIPQDYVWICYVIVVTFITTAVSNSANLTDGIDGLAAGISAIIGSALGILAYVSGHFTFAEYLNIMFIPHTGEVLVFCMAFVGACIGFLWYNAYPAQVFMGDTGSLTLGSIIAVMAFIIRKELLIPVLCGIFFVESLSVILQVSYFKYTKRKYGEGKRIFRMSPLHHHFQLKGLPENTIVMRFWIVGLILAVLTISTLKIR